VISKFVKTNFIVLLLVPYLVGLIGILLPISRSFFLELTPHMLLFSFLLVVIEEGKWIGRNSIPLSLILILSYGAEYVGVNYGYLFGDYTYGNKLLFVLDGGIGINLTSQYLIMFVGLDYHLFFSCLSLTFLKLREEVTVSFLFTYYFTGFYY